MCKKIQLIKIYCTVCHIYDSITARESQRQSNNFCPKFTDEECITVYLWGILNQKFEVKTCYDFIKDYWAEWFPDLPTYQNFNRRVCNLHDVFIQIVSFLITDAGIDSTSLDYLIDSMPIIVANEKRSGSAKVAGEICDKGYCSSKKMYYYGVKVHAVAQKQNGTLPNLFAAWVTPASDADINSARDNLDFIRDINLFADKAYVDKTWKADLASRGVSLVTPAKRKRGQDELEPGEKLINSVISSVRQPVESFFNWLHEKTNIQHASKVRSPNGLTAFIFARFAACFFAV
jgi:hypothetical protein